jgi:periplasmic protein TonB
VRCEDTETDSRVDRMVCRGLDLRSIVIVPIRIQGRPAGVLEVFSSRPHAFETGDEMVLGHFAEMVAHVAARQSEPAPVPPLQNVVTPPTKERLLAEPRADGKKPRSKKKMLPIAMNKQVAPSPPVVKQAELKQQRSEMTAKPQPKSEPVTVVASPIPAVQPPASKPKLAELVESAASPAPVITTLHIDEPSTRSSAPQAPLAGMTAQPLSAMTQQLSALARQLPAFTQQLSALMQRLYAFRKRLSPLSMKIAGAAILATVLVVGGLQSWRATASPKIVPLDTHTTQAQPAPAPAPNVTPRLRAANATTAPTLSITTLAESKPRKAPAITLPSPDIASSAAPPEITLLAHPANEASPISNLLAAPVAAPTLDAPKVSQLSGGKLIRKVDPIYPPSMAQGRQGEVVLKATINRQGQVSKVNIVRGQPVLAQAAIAAVMRWRYEPFLLNGVPIEMENNIVINFKAPGK